jgi:hypothetical protein
VLGRAESNLSPTPSVTSPWESRARVITSRAASPQNHAPIDSSSMRSRSSTVPCHGSIPSGGTNSVVASSSIR